MELRILVMDNNNKMHTLKRSFDFESELYDKFQMYGVSLHNAWLENKIKYYKCEICIDSKEYFGL